MTTSDFFFPRIVSAMTDLWSHLRMSGASEAFYLSDLYTYFWAMAFLFIAFTGLETVLVVLHFPWYYEKGHELARKTIRLAGSGEELRHLFRASPVLSRNFVIRLHEHPERATVRPRFDRIPVHVYFVELRLDEVGTGGAEITLRAACPFFVYPAVLTAIFGWTIGALEPIFTRPAYGLLAELPALFLGWVLLSWHRAQRRMFEGGTHQILAALGLPERGVETPDHPR